MNTPPASRSRPNIATRQRSVSRAPVSDGAEPPTPTTAATSSPRRRRRRTRSEDDDAFLAEPMTSASLRRIGLLLVAGCVLFFWDLFHLMGYIERVEQDDDSPHPHQHAPTTAALRGTTVAWNVSSLVKED